MTGFEHGLQQLGWNIETVSGAIAIVSLGATRSAEMHLECSITVIREFGGWPLRGCLREYCEIGRRDHDIEDLRPAFQARVVLASTLYLRCGW